MVFLFTFYILVSTLESLHKENLITRFGDDKHKEKDIQTLTRSIAKVLKFFSVLYSNIYLFMFFDRHFLN